MKINLSPRLKRSYKKLPFHIQIDFNNKASFFIKNPKDPKLKTHKLKGNLQSYLVFSLSDDQGIFQFF